ncbi:MAG: type II secretion system protein [Kiritimatiellia bacterium]
MTRTPSKSGFTLLEMLVASLLLGMLVSILTMVFNSSSIAWRTGKAGVAQLSLLRRQLSFAQYRADSLLPRTSVDSPNQIGFVVSPWCTQRQNGEFLRTRAVQNVTSSDLGFPKPNFSDLRSDEASLSVLPWQQMTGLGSLRLGSAKSFTVGVLSYGPDGKRDTDDDISTWPDKVE